MVGAALVRRLATENCTVLTVPRSELDLTESAAVHRWMADHRPDAVVIAAAKVGGILANDTYPVQFLLEVLRHEAARAHAVDVDPSGAGSAGLSIDSEMSATVPLPDWLGGPRVLPEACCSFSEASK